MDPLADKVLVIPALVCLAGLYLANAWLVLLVIVRELMVTSIRLVAADKGQVTAANNWGKAKIVSQIIAILVVLFLQYWLELAAARVVLPVTVNEPFAPLFGQPLIPIATVLAAISGLIYLKQNWQVVKTAGQMNFKKLSSFNEESFF